MRETVDGSLVWFMLHADVLVNGFLVVEDFSAFMAHILPRLRLRCASAFDDLTHEFTSQQKEKRTQDKLVCANFLLHTCPRRFYDVAKKKVFFGVGYLSKSWSINVESIVEPITTLFFCGT